ncbi:hypothetical protein [Actinomyces faecalis]|uniref:hypothetical protein n=1 Tax=Actinomyces faecalis TaxID=2722820 RepID=UPI001554B566|nr:hypothetical protein [Actinomyces faecalis]
MMRQMMSTMHTHQDLREAAEREYSAAQAELRSLGASASPSRLERALERFEAARDALALAA